MRALVLGSSPRAPAMLQLALERHRFDITITCNSGIKLLPTPTYYVSVDQLSNRAYREENLAAQKRGTKLVTLKRKRDALEQRGIDHFDEFIQDGDSGKTVKRGEWGPFRYSGPFCLELACHKGAKEIVLAGMCGWRWAFDYFDKDDHPHSHRKCSDDNWHRSMTKLHVEPATNDLCHAYDDVQFICYGQPHYTVDAPNWRVIEPYTIRAAKT